MLGGNKYATRLMCGAAALALVAAAGAARAEDMALNIAPQPLTSALKEFGVKTGRSVLYGPALADTKVSRGVADATDPESALLALLDGTGLSYRREGETFLIVRADADPQSGSAAGDGADNTVEALIVTAQKREEDIQDVPIAISAFTQEALERSQIAGGPDLITQIPNFSFTKTNFTGYSIQIRGIGTQAVSATTDPAVAVAFNNTPFIRNRFFEQEFYDLQRVEVLRGPQGTLYGRNATAGVVNIISAKPKFDFEAKAAANIGNYNTTRIEGMINIPLVEDAVALRLAGAWTKRDGYATNQLTGEQIDGRDLWSTRLSLRFEPTDGISANLIWEHFEEDDDRLRSSKQLCMRHQPTEVSGIQISPENNIANRYLSQGCTRVSLYSDEAFQTPNGHALPYYAPLVAIGLPLVQGASDPYLNATQSRDLRVIESTVEPDYQAKTDIVELQVSIDLTDSLTLDSETAYSADSLFSLQDYNRFTTRPGIFRPNATSTAGGAVIVDASGFFCDPQLGCSNRLLLVDLSTSDSTQFSQEFRLGSDFDGPFNFSLGANFLRHDAEDKYYVFINNLSLWAAYFPAGMSSTAELSKLYDPAGAPTGLGEIRAHDVGAVYADPNPIGALNDMGRNYFLSKNPYKLISYAMFGETYYNVTENLKLTGGLRFTVDKKQAPQIPSWLLVGGGATGPYPTTETLDQEWREPTGRLAVDWKPSLTFTDETLVYASYAHGYKAGGANPPPPVFSTYGDIGARETIPDTFDPEFVDAFELGTKNTLLDGALTLNLTGFYYDYRGYQVSEIRNRSAVNSNYDAEVWGVEVEADWRPLENLKFSFKGGYNGTRIADGETSVDLMDRTAGKEGWVVHRPFPSVPSNCILPEYVVTANGGIRSGNFTSGETSYDGDCIDAYYANLDPVTALPYEPNPTEWNRFGVIEPLPAQYAGYPGFDPSNPEINNGRGFSKQLGGNELPNAPDYTATITADYTLPLAGDWMVALHGDLHWQSESWWRVFNDHEYNRIDEFYTVNLAAIFTNEEAGWNVMAYIKNVLDEDALTGAFLNSDDSGLTTNVFLTEPRLYGVRVTKAWTDAGILGGLTGERRDSTKPYPVQVELGGGVSRFDQDSEAYGFWLSPVLTPSLAVQEQDLDWGDIRDVKLTYTSTGGWRVSAAYRYGKTNGSFRGAAYEDVPGGIFGSITYIERDNHAIVVVHDAEEYSVADFMVGKDIGIGSWGEGAQSTLAAGVRYATFESTARVLTDGITESYVAPTMDFKYGIQSWNRYRTSLDSTRTFEGTGPAISWESSLRLAGDDHGGHADLEWTLGGAVLFGKQVVDSVEDRFGRYYYKEGSGGPPPLGSLLEITHYDELVPRHREDDVTVPNLSLSLGLSYEIDRVKVSTGYSYDRFFDAIDAGFDEAKQFDRTIQGPYFKLSVGFGG